MSFDCDGWSGMDLRQRFLHEAKPLAIVWSNGKPRFFLKVVKARGVSIYN